MSEIKVNLSLELQGGTMLSEQECSKNPKESYNHFQMTINKDPKGRKKETIQVAVRKSRTIMQNIKLSREAYDYMVDGKICPDPKLQKVWMKYTERERLNWHCSQIAEALGATGFSFSILED